MKYILGIVSVLLLVFLILGMRAANTMAETYQAQELRPQSVSDIILDSRRTPSAPPPERQNGIAMGAGLLALVIVTIGGMVFVMMGGARFMKEARLLRKKRPSAPQPGIMPPYASPYQLPGEASTMRRTQRTPELPDWTESDVYPDSNPPDYRG